MLWQIEQVSKQCHWAPEKQICSINSATLGLKFDYRIRAASNLLHFQPIFRHSKGIRRMYHFLAICRQSDRDPTNVVVFLLHGQCIPKMATLQCTPYLPTWILRDNIYWFIHFRDCCLIIVLLVGRLKHTHDGILIHDALYTILSFTNKNTDHFNMFLGSSVESFTGNRPNFVVARNNAPTKQRAGKDLLQLRSTTQQHLPYMSHTDQRGLNMVDPPLIWVISFLWLLLK